MNTLFIDMYVDRKRLGTIRLSGLSLSRRKIIFQEVENSSSFSFSLSLSTYRITHSHSATQLKKKIICKC